MTTAKLPSQLLKPTKSILNQQQLAKNLAQSIMKILALRFKNLNSLRGEWQIDFRHPSYANDGIFAITGKTGAGKSTILDAICLALYGKTPRLNDISKGHNELMSRQTGECFSEVIFATKDGEFICHWAQRRARGKVDGALQTPQHELAEHGIDGKGKVIEHHINKVKNAIIELTGLDFERFTRSMLLAQGSFAKFLQASADERSSLLEGITGTMIYADISIKVHELKREREQALKQLTDYLQSLQLLDADELAALSAQETTLNTELTAIQDTIKQLQAAEQRQKNLNALRNDLHVYQTQLSDIQIQISDFAPSQYKLQRAKRALELAGDYRALQLTRERYQTAQAKHNTLLDQRPAHQAAWQAAQEQTTTHQTDYQQRDQAWRDAQPLLNQIREQDATLRQLISQQQDRQRAQNEQNSHLQQLNHTLHQQQANYTHACQTEQTLAERLAQPIWQNLSQTITRVEGLAANLADIETRYSNAQTDQHRLAEAERDNINQQRQLNAKLTELNAKLATQQTHVNNTQQLMATLLADSSRSDWQQRHTQLTRLEQALQRLDEVQTQARANQNAQQQLHSRYATLQQTLAQLATDIDTQTREQQHTNARVTLLNDNLKLLYKIADLQSERTHLIDGKPCPLCGATTHPYASHQPAAPNTTEQQLSHAQAELASITQALEQLRLQQAREQQNQQQITDQLANYAHEQQHIAAKLTDLYASIGTLDTDNHYQHLTDSTRTNAALQDVQRMLAATQTRLDNIERAEQQLEQASTAHQTLQQAVQACQNQHHLLAHRQQSLAEQLADHHDRLNDLTKQLNRVQREISTQLAPYQTLTVPPFDLTQPISSRSLTKIRHSLDTLQNQIHADQQQLSTNQQRKAELEQTLTRLTAEQTSLQTHLAQAEQDLQNLQRHIAQQHAQRHALFGDKNPDTYAETLSKQRQTALDNWQTAQQTQTDAAHALQTLNADIARLASQLIDDQHDMQQQTTALHTRWAQVGFVDEADYQAATLSEAERTMLQQTADALAQTLVQTQSKQRETQERLTVLEQSSVAPELAALSAQALGERLAQTTAEQQTLSEQRGSVRQQLIQQHQLQAQQRDLLDKIASAESEYRDWQLLHDLIGSNNGKKFRNFAQNLTLNVVVHNANRQLAKMSDRYLLITAPDESLMLNVIDKYQGGEQRTSKNLSGGESFIISLALALGLSHLVGENIRVDSLFLDEGFGTLDEDALDIALDTLTSLHEAGKFIGVISHVTALKDRIANQIQVIPTSGGISQIKGNGVQRLG